MTDTGSIIIQATAVAIGGRALLIEGPPGSGKSSLALALIDRGATLIGDDGITLAARNDRIIASPPPNIEGLLEVRGVGILRFPTTCDIQAALILMLGREAERLPKAAETREICGCLIPEIPFDPGTIAPAPRAELALQQHGVRLHD
ncbi:HPr kinase/phosphorylase [Erythrobacter sp. MTPC3]|uniref:HPr kinase/phosphorylase n=1 Tax=Erythrobacter sp. MTPC3 TaxID=3056564 RepID=UPI0036F2EB1E